MSTPWSMKAVRQYAQVASIAALLAAGCASSDRRVTERAGHTDEFFAAQAAQINRAEIEAGQLALDRASNPRVEQYARMMVDQHRDAQRELETIAARMNASLPNGTDSANRDLAAHLATLDGVRFDREYMSAMVAGHAHALSLYRDKARSISDPTLRSWTERQVPTLERHLSMAGQINSEVGNAAPLNINTSTREQR